MAVDIAFLVNGDDAVVAAGKKVEGVLDRTTKSIDKSVNALGKLEGKLKSFAGQQLGKVGVGALIGAGVSGITGGFSGESVAKDILTGIGTILGSIGGAFGGAALGSLAGPAGTGAGAAIGGTAGASIGAKLAEATYEASTEFFTGDTRKEYQKSVNDRLRFSAGINEFFRPTQDGDTYSISTGNKPPFMPWIEEEFKEVPALKPSTRPRLLPQEELGISEFALGLEKFKKVQYQNNRAFMPNYEHTSN